jgi:hypothetical protein
MINYNNYVCFPKFVVYNNNKIHILFQLMLVYIIYNVFI